MTVRDPSIHPADGATAARSRNLRSFSCQYRCPMPNLSRAKRWQGPGRSAESPRSISTSDSREPGEKQTQKGTAPNAVPFSRCAPSMGATLRVRVPPRGDHPDRSEPQLREGDRAWGGSGERSRGPMNKNSIRGDAERSERAIDREAAMVEAQAA